ncbi:hypothetical protein IWW39_004023 [Coemansia spiralis]|uniref:Uncharacterized protein n=1 Tax=Coemansia spiralis TaxID=417178 RepID=A0A9W8GH76_9FUNG|nr:hypothetical protein IWW39_004023 [Coemansia spiralis]
MGVFNVLLKTGRSGLNTIETFLAHTGISRPSLIEIAGLCSEPCVNTNTNGNPFEEALNLTVNDVWGSVNDHIDQLAPETLADYSTAELAKLKQTMLVHCLKSYDRYTYEHQQKVLMPTAS